MIQENNKTTLNDSLLNLEMISANCGTHLKAIDYSSTHKAFIFCSSNLIHINDLSKNKTLVVLKGHSSRVNMSKWVKNAKLPTIVSVGSDSKCIVWINYNNDVFNANDWKKACEIKIDKEDSINTMDVVYISDKEAYVSFFTSNKNLLVYSLDLSDKDKITSKRLIAKKMKYIIVSLTLSVLNNNNILLLAGGYDNLVSLYTFLRHSEQINNTEEELKYHLALQGHANAIRDIAVDDQIKTSLIATCSQDTYIRLWSIKKLSKEEIKIFESRRKDNITVFDEYKSQTSYVLILNDEESYHLLLESVLSDHEDSVSSVSFYQKNEKETFILTSSFDFSVGVWEFTQGLWQKATTLGEMTGNKHAYFGAIFLDDENSIISYTYTGALYYYTREKSSDIYKSIPIVHGHFGAVTEIAWDKEGKYLLTTSQDQTTRICIFNKNTNNWVEAGRPQIHGYDINSVAIIPESNNPNNLSLVSKFVSASEEKIIRMFEPSYSLVKFLNELSGLNSVRMSKDKLNEDYEKSFVQGNKQALGLMTKQEVADDDDMKFDITNFDPTALLTNQKPSFYTNNESFLTAPDEDFLTNHTLWPEMNKLYGHSFEVFALASSHKGDVFASAGSAKSEKYSQLYIWNVNSNNVLQKLEGHVLTIVQIVFSPDDEMILAVSRDRSWCLYKRKEDKSYYLFQTEKECHLRILWGCSFSSDNEFFVTGSRDTFTKLWKRNQTDNKYSLVNEVEHGESVTSVELIQNTEVLKERNDENKNNTGMLLLVGFEKGEIKVFKIILENSTYSLVMIKQIVGNISFGGKVHRIKSVNRKNENRYLVACCGDDHTSRIFSLSYDLFLA